MRGTVSNTLFLLYEFWLSTPTMLWAIGLMERRAGRQAPTRLVLEVYFRELQPFIPWMIVGDAFISPSPLVDRLVICGIGLVVWWVSRLVVQPA